MDTLNNLLQISTPKTFQKGEFICHEGEPGKEMYVVLQGSVDIYINTVLEGSIRVANVTPGNFFGEMAIFDNLPRNASCVAHDQTVCIAIGKEKLHQFVTLSPDIAEKLIISLSSRVRDLNDKLFKVNENMSAANVHAFAIPAGHKSMDYIRPQCDLRFIDRSQSICPVCEKPVVIEHVREHELTVEKTLPNQRPVYREGDTLWHQVWHCPHCGYSNHYINFFQIESYERSSILRVVNNQSQYWKNIFKAQSSFDSIAFQFYQAIHFNECFNASATLLLGKLWECLYWLYGDVELRDMESLCREKTVEYYRKTFHDHPEQLPASKSKQKCAFIIAELLLEMGKPKEARAYFSKVTEYPNTYLQDKAYDRIREFRDGKFG